MRRETSLVSVLQGIRVLGRDVLKERPTEGDIEQLTTQTNAQHRFAQLSHRFRQISHGSRDADEWSHGQSPSLHFDTPDFGLTALKGTRRLEAFPKEVSRRRFLPPPSVKATELAKMAALEDRYWWFVGRRFIVAALLRHFGQPATNPPLILDLGCGTGGSLGLLRRFGRVVGLDASPDALAFAARKQPDVPLVRSCPTRSTEP